MNREERAIMTTEPDRDLSRALRAELEPLIGTDYGTTLRIIEVVRARAWRYGEDVRRRAELRLQCKACGMTLTTSSRQVLRGECISCRNPRCTAFRSLQPRVVPHMVWTGPDGTNG